MAQQTELFPSLPRVIADDARGSIVYEPGLFTTQESDALFDELLAHSPWSHETMWMYDKMVDVPRLVARFMPGEQLPPALARLVERVEKRLGARFNSVGLNYYRDGNDSVAWHNDHTEDLIALPAIAIVSLGAARQMLVRPKKPPRTAIACDLEPGSLFVMSGRSQEFWEHSIPKARRPTAARISVALRQRQEHSGAGEL
ncbi:MAG: alpha-ketoglutarate-dependent dioxygenase AlkB family protein [Vulcanimicrobiaceae bacterium]